MTKLILTDATRATMMLYRGSMNELVGHIVEAQENKTISKQDFRSIMDISFNLFGLRQDIVPHEGPCLSTINPWISGQVVPKREKRLVTLQWIESKLRQRLDALNR